MLDRRLAPESPECFADVGDRRGLLRLRVDLFTVDLVSAGLLCITGQRLPVTALGSWRMHAYRDPGISFMATRPSPRADIRGLLDG